MWLSGAKTCLLKRGSAQVLLSRYTKQDDISVGSPMCAALPLCLHRRILWASSLQYSATGAVKLLRLILSAVVYQGKPAGS